MRNILWIFLHTSLTDTEIETMIATNDASDLRCGLNEHESSPEIHCVDWGIYLGCNGRKRNMIIIGKDVVEVHNKWGASRISVELVEGITEILPRSEMIKYVKEISVIGRRVSIRKYVGEGECY